MYPFRQHKLKMSKNNEVKRKSHRDDLCEKCIFLGMSCILWIEEQRKKKKMEQESKKKEIENINSVQKAMNKLSLS